ncbi:endoglucanase [Halobacteriales archaeon QS_8_69_26]|nr:MAG: endoglucanase [Halobacteriales archaeon QS_8_69_26]
MEAPRREFLEDLLTTPSPSGYEARGQRVWVDYVEAFADDVRTDEYGNAIAVYEGGEPAVAVTGHADEIGFIVRKIDEEGFVHFGRIGGSDKTVSKGQHVTIHGDDPVPGVIGQTAIHLREGDGEYDDVEDQRIDIGVEDGDEARELVEVGDPITFSSTVQDLEGTKMAARGMDNRVGTWVAAEALRRAADSGVEATVYAVSTVQEEVGLKGARMAGYELAPDAAIAVDVTHATDYAGAPGNKGGDIELGEGPVIARGSTNNPALVEAVRTAADEADIDYQLQAAGLRTGTDADAFYTQRSGIPSLNVGLPNRYMHTPVEVVDTEDLVDVADLMGAFADRAADYESFGVEI